MNRQDKRKINAHQNQQLIEREETFNAHWQLGFDKQIDDREYLSDIRPNQQISKLLCACGGRCEGICKEQHLYRVRIANPKATAKEAAGIKSWTNPPNKCPSANEG